jgi:hypothetical protein
MTGAVSNPPAPVHHLTSPASRLRTLGATTARELAAARCLHVVKATWSEHVGHCTASETARLRAVVHARASEATLPEAHRRGCFPAVAAIARLSATPRRPWWRRLAAWLAEPLKP